jgi:hypothetical protein
VERTANGVIAPTTPSADATVMMQVMTAVIDTEGLRPGADLDPPLRLIVRPADIEVPGTAIAATMNTAPTTVIAGIMRPDPIGMIGIRIEVRIGTTKTRKIPTPVDQIAKTAKTDVSVTVRHADIPVLHVRVSAKNEMTNVVTTGATSIGATPAETSLHLRVLQRLSLTLRNWRKSVVASWLKCNQMPLIWNRSVFGESLSSLRKNSSSKRLMIDSALTVADSCLMLTSVCRRIVLMNGFVVVVEGFRRWRRTKDISFDFYMGQGCFLFVLPFATGIPFFHDLLV